MATFGGTTQKCKACEKTVYLVDQLKADSKVYHKACFRCNHCKGTLKVIYELLHFLTIIYPL
ncbi:Pollen-specific protein SF3 [Capsicum annuum]|uniref:Pollen-specific protein SF3 n=1 Tax=Capsicum annuum TaxID=4072 RepID=A0A2G2YWF1_CAPAN|nr:Pollen-specific protein SF3 [Capsicum annuum]PHT74098.1 Pollen-specific protein SF3 [Capsicum annuum]